jgi:mono/diheme cytochrome c family protein
MAILKRLIILLAVVSVPLAVGLLFTYDIIKIDSFNPQEDPLPVPARSVPVQGAAYIPVLGAPSNPVAADEDSLKRGKANYEIGCRICHGSKADGKGPFAAFLANKPANLLEGRPVTISDGEIFMTITNGIEGKMPNLRENFPEAEMRWDVVNYVRSLQKGK